MNVNTAPEMTPPGMTGFEKTMAVGVTGLSASLIELGNLMQKVQWDSFARMPAMTPDMQVQALNFLSKSATPLEIGAGALALVTLDTVLKRLPPDNALLRLQENIRKAPQAMIGFIAEKMHSPSK